MTNKIIYGFEKRINISVTIAHETDVGGSQMFNRVVYWVFNIWILFAFVISLVNFIFDFDIVMKWSVTNHIVQYLHALPLVTRVVALVISIIVWFPFARVWWIYPKSKAKAS